MSSKISSFPGALLVLLGEGVALLCLLAPGSCFHLFLAFLATELLRDCAGSSASACLRALSRRRSLRDKCGEEGVIHTLPSSMLPLLLEQQDLSLHVLKLASLQLELLQVRADPSSEDCSASRLSKSAKVAACRLPEVMRARKPYRQAQKLVHSRQQQQQRQHEEDKTKEGKP